MERLSSVSNSNGVNFNHYQRLNRQDKVFVSNSNGVNFNLIPNISIDLLILCFKLQRSKF